jgi:hypothetical protein
MTMTAEQTPRQNADGHACPPWCVIDHDTDVGGGHRYTFHGSETVRVEVPGKARYWADEILVRAIHGGRSDDAPQIDLSATRFGADRSSPHAWIAPREAEDLAVIVEMLAKATPAQHRELAAAIRKAAADISDANGAQS